MSILIKRYVNRKLYNTDTSRYITLKGIAELLDAGKEVRVIDNETGEDITSIALSQILVDSKRTRTSPPHTLLSQILGRGGDALYGALRKSVDDATDGLGEFQERMRRIVGAESLDEIDESEERRRSPRERTGLGQWGHASADFEKLIHRSMERVFRVLDLPSRTDIEAMNGNLERVASAIETLERALTASAAPADAPKAARADEPERPG